MIRYASTELLKQRIIETLNVLPKNEVERKDLKQLVYSFFIIRKMARAFIKSGNMNEKLFINNLIIILNQVSISKTTESFIHICNEDELSVIKSCLLFLNSCDKKLNNINSNARMNDVFQELRQQYTS